MECNSVSLVQPSNQLMQDNTPEPLQYGFGAALDRVGNMTSSTDVFASSGATPAPNSTGRILHRFRPEEESVFGGNDGQFAQSCGYKIVQMMKKPQYERIEVWEKLMHECNELEFKEYEKIWRVMAPGTFPQEHMFRATQAYENSQKEHDITNVRL